MRPFPLLAFSVGHALDDGFIDMIPPLLPVFAERYGLTNAAIGSLMLALTIPSNFGQPFLGLILDRHRYRGAAAGGLLLALVGIVAAVLSGSVAALAGGLFVVGMGTAVFHPAAAAWVGDIGGRDRRATALAVFGGVGSAGYALGAIVGPWLYVRYGMQGIAWAAAIACGWVVVCLIAERMHERTTGAGRALALMWAGRAGLVPVLAATTLRSAAVGAFAVFLPVLAKERGIGLTGGGALLFGFLAAGAVGVSMGGVADRVGRRRLTIVTLLVGAPLMAAGALGTSVWATALICLAGSVLRMGEPANIAQAQEIMVGGAGTAAGMAMGMSWGLAGLTYPAVGAVADAAGMGRALALWSALCLLAVVPAWLMPETKPVREGEA